MFAALLLIIPLAGDPTTAQLQAAVHEANRTEIKVLLGGDVSYESGSSGQINPFALVEAHVPVFIGSHNPFDFHIESRFAGTPGSTVDLQTTTFKSVDFEVGAERDLSPDAPTHLLVGVVGRVVSLIGAAPTPLNKTPASGYIQAKVSTKDGGEFGIGIGFSQEAGADACTCLRVIARAPILNSSGIDYFYIGGDILIPLGPASWNYFTNQGHYGVVTRVYTTINLGAVQKKLTS